MTLRLRGVFMLLAAVLGIVVNVLDAADDGFSVWNGVGIALFIVVGVYGLAWIFESHPDGPRV
jgi:hypothetical protein